MNDIKMIHNNTANNNSNTGNTNDDDDNEDILKQIKDDDYYMERKGLVPPRFYYYKHIKALRYGDSTYLYETQDELDFYLKRDLKKTPEERYQYEKKEGYFFHRQSSYMRGLSSDDWNKGCTNLGCIRTPFSFFLLL
jgi:hypothetical protein